MSEDNQKVFLVTTEKEGKIQHQFTGGSPLEEINTDVIRKKDNGYEFNLDKVRENASIRTKNRTGVEALEEYNTQPFVDWVLMEHEENGEIFYKLVCLMHFIVKKYTGVLKSTGKECVIGGDWYDINNLPNQENASPNAYIVSKKAVEFLNRKNKIAILSDFSKTLTAASNPTTWSIFARSGLLGEKYTQKRDEYYEKYHEAELSWNILKTKEWWSKHLELFVSHKLSKELIEEIAKDIKYFQPRGWLQEFFEKIQEENIDFFISSSGVSNFIEAFFDVHKIPRKKIHIQWNTLIFNENYKASSFYSEKIITPLNKGDHWFDLEGYKKIIILWDDNSDVSMYPWECLRIGFCNSEDISGFDVYLEKEGNIIDVLKYL